ncbi:MAG: 5-methyltetrahydropteroyltriglutamate--homocysteine methyltransferase [Halobacteriales archaeon]|nr:5-methyltetrahydropteroyltriglutamate--homocysteine methyltransferase [Halobacteriales archaeon]
MPEYVATTPGLFPLPDWAKESLSDLKGHQKHDLIGGDESDAIVDEYDAARAELVETQTAAGLDRVVEGQLRWDDMLAHPLAVHDAVETRGIVRYYDNNNFYRDPAVVEPLTPSGDVAAELEAAAALTDAPLQAVLPGPYSLADLATDEHYGDEAAFVEAVGEFLAGEVGAFPDAETLFLLEPSLVSRPPDDATRPVAADAIAAVSDAFDGEVVVHGYWGAYDEATHAALLDAPVDAIGYDLVSAPEAAAALVREQGTADSVALGVVDGQNTLVETPEGVREQVAWFESQLDAAPERVYVAPNTELFYLPVSKAEAKLAVLGEAARPEVAA